MDEEILELMMKRLENLEKRVEKYFDMLERDNELDFVFNGSYLLDDKMKEIMEGNY